MKKNYDEFEEFQNNKNIRILFIRKILTGKISLLNSIIGNNKYKYIYYKLMRKNVLKPFLFSNISLKIKFQFVKVNLLKNNLKIFER